MDTEVGSRLDKNGTPETEALRGRAAIANARLAYELFETKSASQHWQDLAAAGANAQRPLWASTSVKDPALPDTMYITELVAPGTVNTMPEATIEAMADHGDVRGDTVHGTYDAARQVFADLEDLGISYDEVVEALEEDGVSKFKTSWDELPGTISRTWACSPECCVPLPVLVAGNADLPRPGAREVWRRVGQVSWWWSFSAMARCILAIGR